MIAITILCEAMHRCFDPENHHHHEHLLLPVSVGGLFVNLVGLVFFHEHHSHGGVRCSHSVTKCNHSNCNLNHNLDAERRAGHANNMHGVFLHILADTLGSVGVVVSSYFIKHYGWRLADPICAIIISALILGSTWPLLRDTSLRLLSHKGSSSSSYRSKEIYRNRSRESYRNKESFTSNDWEGVAV